METTKQSELIIMSWVNKNRKRYVRMAAAWLKDCDAAEDAVQLASLDALKPGKFDPKRPVGPWFNQVLCNRCKMIKRSRNRRPEINETEMPLMKEEVSSDAWMLDSLTESVITFRTKDGGVVDMSMSEILDGVPELDASIILDLYVNEMPRMAIKDKYRMKPGAIEMIERYVRTVAVNNIGAAIGAF